MDEFSPALTVPRSPLLLHHIITASFPSHFFPFFLLLFASCHSQCGFYTSPWKAHLVCEQRQGFPASSRWEEHPKCTGLVQGQGQGDNCCAQQMKVAWDGTWWLEHLR